MDIQWKEKFLLSMVRGSPDREREFLELVDQVEGACSLEIAHVLMKSFSNVPDFGTQERVVSALASAEKAVSIKAILEELPRLLAEAPDWAEVLVGQEVDRRPELLVQIAQGLSLDVRQALRQLLANPDFRDIYPNASVLVI